MSALENHGKGTVANKIFGMVLVIPNDFHR